MKDINCMSCACFYNDYVFGGFKDGGLAKWSIKVYNIDKVN